MRLKSFVKQAGGTISDLFNLPLDVLDGNPDNIRLDTEDLRSHIRAIADSIKQTGFLRSRALTVRLSGDRAIVVDGNCRLMACRLAVAEGAPLLTIPCVPEAPGTTPAERISNMVKANSGLGHNPLEMTVAVKRLVSFGWTTKQIADDWGRSRAYVDNLIELSGAPDDVREAITNGTISATQALTVMKTEGDNAGAVIAAVAAKARAEGKSRVTAKAFKPEGKPETVKAPAVAVAPPVGLLGASREVLRIWDSGSLDNDFTEAMEALRSAVA